MVGRLAMAYGMLWQVRGAEKSWPCRAQKRGVTGWYMLDRACFPARALCICLGYSCESTTLVGCVD